MDDLRYPIGPFKPVSSLDQSARQVLLTQLEETPRNLRSALVDFSESRLDTPYRPGGWTVRQAVHHLADAQMNWYIRTKLALTEDCPTIKPYDENLWAGLFDAKTAPIEPSLILLEGLYQRWSTLYRALSEEQWKRQMVHPERGTLTLEFTLTLHVWHGRHHTAHIVELRKRMGWS
jgi:hypothetical protein